MRSDFLFSKNSILDVLPHQEQELKKAVAEYDANKLLNTSVDDLVNYFVERFKIEPPILKEDQIEVDSSETQIDVSHDFGRAVSDRSRPAYVPGTTVTMIVPFEGEAQFFEVRPRSYSLNPPQGRISGSELHLSTSYIHDQADATAVKQSLASALEQVRSHLQNHLDEAMRFNGELVQKAKALIENRRKRLLDSTGIAGALGYPMRRRTDSMQAYTAPEIRRKITPTPPTASTEAYKPEPVLSDEEYEYILRLIKNSMEVLERSPRAFADMGEEDLRTQILVMLNSHYEGQATGETFNYTGKSDIYVRSGAGNVFVAECKFWNGPKKLLETIDQLLGYVTWRDTKTAIINFNRNKGFMEVLATLKENVKKHPHFKRMLSQADSGHDLRLVFGHPGDPNREVFVSFLSFDIPGNGEV